MFDQVRQTAGEKQRGKQTRNFFGLFWREAVDEHDDDCDAEAMSKDLGQGNHSSNVACSCSHIEITRDKRIEGRDRNCEYSENERNDCVSMH